MSECEWSGWLELQRVCRGGGQLPAAQVSAAQRSVAQHSNTTVGRAMRLPLVSWAAVTAWPGITW